MNQYYISSESYVPLLYKMGSQSLQLQNEDTELLALTSPKEVQIFDKFSHSPIYQYCFNADSIFTDRELACVLSVPPSDENASILDGEEYTDLALLYLEKFSYTDFYPPYLKAYLENSTVIYAQAEQSQTTLETNQDLVLTQEDADQAQISFPGVADCHVVVVQNLKSGDVYFGHISPSGNLENLETFLNANDAQFSVQIYRSNYGATNADSIQKLRSIKLLLQNTEHTLQVENLGGKFFDVTLSINDTVRIVFFHNSTLFSP